MGGYGSGRSGGRNCTDGMRRLDVRQLAREGLLTAGRSFLRQWTCNGEVSGSIKLTVEEDAVLLDYRQRSGGDWEPMSYYVRLDWTPCHLGGDRPWWLCPARGCDRRVAVLYGGRVFACRRCHHLAYPSQREVDHDRLARRADRFRERLGWEPGILNGNGVKPKGMHWQTFDRLQAQHDACVGASLNGISVRLGLGLARSRSGS